MRTTVGAAFVAGVMLLAGCGGGQPQQTMMEPAPAHQPASQRPVGEDGQPWTDGPSASGAMPDATSSPAEVVKAFGRPQVSALGTTVTVGPPKGFTTSATAAPRAGVKASRFTVILTAPKSQAVDPSMTSVSASHDGEGAVQVSDSAGSGLRDAWELPKLRPGKTVEFDVAFVGAPSGQWDIDVEGSDRTMMWSTDGTQ